MKFLSLPAPAKINLFLHVLGRRADGYHNIQTAFQFLDICDQLTFSERQDQTIYLSPFANIPTEKNLIWRAAHLLQEATKYPHGADIAIEKNLPMGGGLGGGSSDAATTLLALNQLWQTGYSMEQLAALGSQLGADVPIFIYGHSAWAEGKGDQIQAIIPQECDCLVVIPSCQVSTEEIYSASELTRNTAPITIGEFFAVGGHNDCEAVARRCYPAIDQALTWLGQFTNARMTGTGSCIYGMFQTKEDALNVATQAPKNFGTLVTRAVNRSPTHTALNHWGVAKR